MREVKDLHEPFVAYLQKHSIPHVYHRPDKKSGIKSGWPDFTVVWAGRTELVEFKVPGGKLSEAQEKVIQNLSSSGTRVLVTGSLWEAIGCIDALTGFKSAVEPNPVISQPSPKLWLSKSPSIGTVVVRKIGANLDFVRVATVEDLERYPYLAKG